MTLPVSVAVVLLAALLLALLVAWGTGRLIGLLSAAGQLDRPNDRSSHSAPTPRGAGLLLIPAVLSAWSAVLAGLALTPPPGFLAVVVGALVLYGVSWADDRGGLRPGPRLLAQAAAVLLGLGAMGEVGPVFQGLLPPWLDLAASAFLWIWFVNLYNFMDGIDGLAGVETLGIALGLAALALLLGWGLAFAAVPLLLAAATLGFLYWNWAPARIFLGDVGSVPLGYLLGWLLLLAAARGAWAAALILPAYHLADSGITLLKRVWRKERFWHAHREHYYQRAATAGLGHSGVSLSVGALDLLLIAMALAAENPEFGRWRVVFLLLALTATAGLLAVFAMREKLR